MAGRTLRRKGLLRVQLSLKKHRSQELARTPIGSVTSSFKTKITCKGVSWHSAWLLRRHDSIQLAFQTLSAVLLSFHHLSTLELSPQCPPAESEAGHGVQVGETIRIPLPCLMKTWVGGLWRTAQSPQGVGSWRKNVGNMKRFPAGCNSLKMLLIHLCS